MYEERAQNMKNLVGESLALARRMRGRVEHEDSWMVDAVADQIEEFAQEVESELADLQEHLGVQTVYYRMKVPQNREINLAMFGESLLQFQRALTLFFSAIKSGIPRDGFSVSKSDERLSSLVPVVLRHQSLGVVLELPKPDTLIHPEQIELAIQSVFGAASVQTAEEVHRYAETFGRAPIAALRDWALANAEVDASVELRLRREEGVPNLELSAADFAHVHLIISGDSEPMSTLRELRGRVIGGRVDREAFWFESEDGESFSGRSEVDLGGLELGSIHTIRVREDLISSPSTGESKTRWTLLQVLD